MYILIDTDLMQVIAKHPNVQYLNELGILRCSESAAVIPLEVSYILDTFNDVDLQKLYISLTGNKQGCLYPRMIIGKILHYYLNNFKETVIHDNVGAQAQWAIDNDLQGDCAYAVSGSIPVNEPNGEGLRTFPQPEAEKALTTEPSQPTNMGQQGAWQPGRERSSTTAPSNHSNSTAPRASGTRDIIFSVADRMWEEAGKPTDKSIILKLRKEMMTVLESEGVKRNTSSNTLGLWVKERGLN